MRIGVPKEIKANEHRVGLTPTSVRELVERGHAVQVEHNAGIGIGFTDDHYTRVGATIAPDAKTVFAEAEMIVKVKEPQAVECKMLREDQILFTYLHLAADPEQTQGLRDSGCIAIAYETVTSRSGGFAALGTDVGSGRQVVRTGRSTKFDEKFRRHGLIARRACRV